MADLSVVQLVRPEMLEVSQFLREMATKFADGEFDSLILLSFRPDGQFMTSERGKRHNRLEMIGLLESMKADLLATMQTEDS